MQQLRLLDRNRAGHGWSWLVPALLFGVLGHAEAGVWVVDVAGGGDYSSIGEAFAAAAHGDTISVRPGVYIGKDNRNLDFGDRSLFVCSSEGPEVTTIDCQDTSRAFLMEFVGPEPAVIQGFTIVNAHAYHDTVNVYDGFGGAIYCRNSAAALVDLVLRDNTSDEDGGAVFMTGGGPYEVLACSFINNTAPDNGWGGALYVSATSSFTMSNCDVIGNMSENWGGGLQTETAATNLVDVRFVGNRSNFGGAANFYFADGTVTVTDCLFEGNWAEHHGGAVCCLSSAARFEGCSFVRNSARYYSGAVGVGNVPSEFEGCQFFRNEVREHDGAVITTSRSSIITDCTFAHNSTPDGAAIVSSGAGRPVITNTLFAFNENGPGLICLDTSVPEVSFCCSYGNAVTDSLCGDCHDNIYIDPAFCDTTGGFLGLQDCSPCIGSGFGGSTIGGCDAGCPCEDPTGLPELSAATITHRCRGNPGARGVVIEYALPDGCGDAVLRMFDAAGRLVYCDSGSCSKEGSGEFRWSGVVAGQHPAASGVYFYRLSACGASARGRFILLR